MLSLNSANSSGRGLPSQRRLAARAALLLTLCVPMHLATAQNVDQMINECLQQQTVSDRQNAEFMEARRVSDPYLNAHANRPVSTSGSGDNGFSCYETTKGAIDGMLQQSGLFGGAIGAIIGQWAQGEAGGACGKARQAISGEFRKTLLGAGVNGGVINAGTRAVSGVINGGTPEQYIPGVAAAGVRGVAQEAGSGAAPAARGAISSLGSKMSCFITGRCQPE